MFFYNQRFLFFAGSGLFLLTISGLTVRLGGDVEFRTIITLWFFWFIGVGYTLALHSRFRKRLGQLADTATTSKLPSLFGEYFILDFCTVSVMIFSGRSQGLNLDAFAFLLVANTIMYGAYVGSGRGFSLLIPGVLYLLLIFTFLFLQLPRTEAVKLPPKGLDTLLYWGALGSVLIVTVVSVTLISWIRALEYQTTQRQLGLLGKYESLLAGTDDERKSQSNIEQVEKFSERNFRRRVLAVLEDLCSLHKQIFWYDSACMWLVKNHKDRGPLLVPGPSINFEETTDVKQGINASLGFLSGKELLIINSMKYRRGKLAEIKPRFRADVDAAAAFIPLKRSRERIGVLALYGKEAGPPPQRQDRAFLQSLGQIVSNTMEQWEGRFRTFPQRDMNDLLKCRSLDDVFKRVVKILQEYLLAGACEVIFRPDAGGEQMKVVSALGFIKNRVDLEYLTTRGKTGECARKGETIRYDDVNEHRAEFDAEYLRSLEKAHGKPILSWMAIPIGKNGHNHGLIKVVNRTSPWGWFTDEDQQLGEDLALRLLVIIEKFLYIKETEEARRDAQEQARQAELHAKNASKLQQLAEDAGHQRQMDLMTMTHQLQGPLNPVIGTLSGLQQAAVPRGIAEEIEFAKALAESCLTLCWGTSATFAKNAGQTISFSIDEIDAPSELRRLCRMLQLTNTDNDLKFRYKEDLGFPKLRMDPAVFTSVVFSLIHNAMKYADRFSTVHLECTFERETGEAALKVKSVGVRIYPHEKESIFEPFVRGQALRKTNFKYSGTGLGLWVAKQLMLSAHGDLTVELSNEHPDLSVFIVHIPRSDGNS